MRADGFVRGETGASSGLGVMPTAGSGFGAAFGASLGAGSADATLGAVFAVLTATGFPKIGFPAIGLVATGFVATTFAVVPGALDLAAACLAVAEAVAGGTAGFAETFDGAFVAVTLAASPPWLPLVSVGLLRGLLGRIILRKSTRGEAERENPSQDTVAIDFASLIIPTALMFCRRSTEPPAVRMW